MSQQMIVDCNECKQEFGIAEVKVRRLEEGIEENYFVCSHCQHEYTSFYTNIEIRSEQKKMQQLYSRLRSTKGLAVREKIEDRIKKSKEEFSKMIDELKHKMKHKPE